MPGGQKKAPELERVRRILKFLQRLPQARSGTSNSKPHQNHRFSSAVFEFEIPEVGSRRNDDELKFCGAQMSGEVRPIAPAI
jgi:hypothetical protein